MGCIGHRHQHAEVRPEYKWDYISLNDFKSTSCWTPFAYGYLHYLLIVSVAVYGVDSFTAINLLAFNKWPSEIKPAISFDISRWIFSVCIILSFLNLGYEHIRANRIMRRGSVAESYLDNLAVRLESIRWGRGQGYKRFLVFAELTKSKKGAEYVALFTYFSFQSWFPVIFCFGPRQFVNALTLYSVYNAQIAAQGDNVGNAIMDFFAKIKALAEREPRLAVILGGMLFTLVVWVLSMLALLLSVLFFVFFLWGYIPKEHGNLSTYCSRKINKRLMKIVSVKVNKAIEEEEHKRKKAELKAAMKAGETPPMELKATLPDVGGDSLPKMPSLARTDTMTTLPPYASRPGTPGSFELGSMDQKRPMPSRTATMASTNSTYSARQPLMGAAAEFGRSSPAPPVPPLGLNRTNSTNTNTIGDFPPHLTRTGTMASNRSVGAQSPMGRMQSNGSLGGGYTTSPGTYSSETMPSMPRSVASPLRGPHAPRGFHGPQYSNTSLSSGMPTPSRFDEYANNGRASPAPSMHSHHSNANPLSPRGPGGVYPVRSATNPMPSRQGPPGAPQRNMTAPVPWQQDRHLQSSRDDGYDAYDDGSAAPGSFQPQQQRQQQPRGRGDNDADMAGPAPWRSQQQQPPEQHQQINQQQQQPARYDGYDYDDYFDRPSTSGAVQQPQSQPQQRSRGGFGYRLERGPGVATWVWRVWTES